MNVITVREALGLALQEELERDPSVFLIGEEVGEYQGAYKISQGLLEKFGPKRIIDTPISEHGFAGIAVGAAFGGLKPVVEFMSFNFALQAMDQIINSAAKTNYMSGGQLGCSVVFRGPNGAAAGVAAQHSQCFASWYAHIPGIKVIAPYFAADYKGLLKAAIRDPNPVVFLENEIAYGHQHEISEEELSSDYLVEIGRAAVVQEGTDVTIVAFSLQLKHALEAADILKAQGINPEIIDLRTIRPLDAETILQSVEKTNRIVTVEEGWPTCGLGAEITALINERAFDYLDAPVERVTAKDVPLPYAINLERLALPQVENIVEAVRKVLYYKLPS
ncbi:2-oxoisovalerate dehydrogenase subunit beta [Anaplasma platys]|uniref:Pyruvate dehydrogenase E1 component subunit beta n=1 Tax=Anaplasma platys TaxID=949 RepID=A0A858PZH0_9RICK|nr:pyruvate dehydrogenase complex E1 component subunit beta [Anaplasma platys]QJC27938.1 2-oxoisovalerate dehydrogenase subunit beta [Anaplasma platys]